MYRPLRNFYLLLGLATLNSGFLQRHLQQLTAGSRSLLHMAIAAAYAVVLIATVIALGRIMHRSQAVAVSNSSPAWKDAHHD